MEPWERLVLIGAAFMALGILIFKKGKKKQLRCTVPVIATAVRIEEGKGSPHDKPGEAGGYEYTPVYTYQANGREYTWKGPSSPGKKEYRKGDKIQLWYNPENPVEATDKEAARGSGGAALIMAILGILAFVGAFMQLK